MHMKIIRYHGMNYEVKTGIIVNFNITVMFGPSTQCDVLLYLVSAGLITVDHLCKRLQLSIHWMMFSTRCDIKEVYILQVTGSNDARNQPHGSEGNSGITYKSTEDINVIFRTAIITAGNNVTDGSGRIKVSRDRYVKALRCHLHKHIHVFWYIHVIPFDLGS